MPFYEYKCTNCGHHLEELQTMSESPLTKCPKCGKNTLKKLIGSGAGLIFKGSGFYMTDYKKTGSGSQKNKPEERTGKSKKKDAADTKSAETDAAAKTPSNKKENK